MNLTADLRQAQQEIEKYAREFGLDFFETHFELLEYDELNEVAAFGGFPSRYPHWRHGMAYEELLKSYTYGISKIYELVINNNPCIAYLMVSNDFVSQKLVMAHVYGHCDFFKNNMWFGKTNRKMIDQMANHSARVRRYMDHYGRDKVETFIDAVLSLENLIDPALPFTKPLVKKDVTQVDDDSVHIEVTKLKSKDYMDRFINPPEALAKQRESLERKRGQKQKFPEEPVHDVLWFLMNYAPLRNWQRDVVQIVRDEAYYFAPQRQTKIMNEGWASYWHSTIMTKKAAKASEIVDFADHHSMTMGGRTGPLNPYKLGIELFRDIEYRWDHGMHGLEWERCDDIHKRESWDTGARGEGRKKIFEVRKVCNDLTFIDEYLTEDFCKRSKLFAFDYNPQSGQYEISSREVKTIREKLLRQLTNAGEPRIYVEDGNYRNRGELLLMHRHDGYDLDPNYSRETLRSLFKVWNRPVSLASKHESKDYVLSFDGRDFTENGTKGR